MLLRRSRAIFALSFCLFSMLITSCSNRIVTDDGSIEFEYHNEAEQKAAFAQAKLTCENPADCPQSVGLIVMSRPDYNVGQCTGFLVSDRVVATNRHCLPETITSLSSPCQDQINITFTNGLKRGCKQMLAMSQKTLLNKVSLKSDYAFFEVDSQLPASMVPFDIDRSEPLHLGTVKTHFVNPDPDSRYPSGVLVSRNCTLLRKTIFHYDLKFGPTLQATALRDCKIIGGNSGSPILNEQGKAIGIVYATINSEEFEKILKSDTNIEVDPQIRDRNYGLMSNFACLHHEIPGVIAALVQVPEGCTGQADRSSAEMLDLDQLLQERIDRDLQLWADNNPSNFLWTIKELPTREGFVMVPGCFLPGSPLALANQWENPMKPANTVTNGNFSQHDYQLKHWKLKLKIGLELEVSLDVQEDTVWASLAYNQQLQTVLKFENHRFPVLRKRVELCN